MGSRKEINLAAEKERLVKELAEFSIVKLTTKPHDCKPPNPNLLIKHGLIWKFTIIQCSCGQKWECIYDAWDGEYQWSREYS